MVSFVAFRRDETAEVREGRSLRGIATPKIPPRYGRMGIEPAAAHCRSQVGQEARRVLVGKVTKSWSKRKEATKN